MRAPTPPDSPLAQFFQLVPDGLPPRRADKSVGGVIPARALRYCEAITSASAFGWYVFLPMNFKVVWDGHDMLWTYPGVDEWLPLTRDAVQYPGFREHFDRHAPEDVRGFSPPFLSPSIQPGRCRSGPAASLRPRRAGACWFAGWRTCRRARPTRCWKASSKPTPGSARCSTTSACSRPTSPSSSVPTSPSCRSSRSARSFTPTNSYRISLGRPGRAVAGELGGVSSHRGRAQHHAGAQAWAICGRGAQASGPCGAPGAGLRMIGGATARPTQYFST